MVLAAGVESERTAQAIPGGGGIVPNVARASGERSWEQCRHDQALVGAERSRVGIRLGLRAFSKPDDDTGTLRGEIPCFNLCHFLCHFHGFLELPRQFGEK